MKKTVLAAPSLPSPGATQLRQHRQVGLGLGERWGNWQYPSCRTPAHLVGGMRRCLPDGSSGDRAIHHNNAAGSDVSTPLVSADFSGTYPGLADYNNSCNYSVEGGILAHSNHPAEAVRPARAIGIRLPAQAASCCPDSEQFSNFSALSAASARRYHLVKAVPCFKSRSAGFP